MLRRVLHRQLHDNRGRDGPHRQALHQMLGPLQPGGRVVNVKFEPRDVWIGWFWDRRADGTHHYVCVVPMIVMHWVRQR